MSYSKLIVLGTLSGDIDKQLRGTDVITAFSLKVTRTNDEQEETTRYIQVTAWNKAGEPLAGAKEGDAFLIEGNSLVASAYINNDGKPRGTLGMTAGFILPLGHINVPGYVKLTLAGNIGKDPEMKYLETGKAVTNFSLAVSRKDKGGNKHTTWYEVAAWERTAEIVANYTDTGSRLLVEANDVYPNAYISKTDGKPRANLKLSAFHIALMDKAPEEDEEPVGAASASNEIPF